MSPGNSGSNANGANVDGVDGVNNVDSVNNVDVTGTDVHGVGLSGVVVAVVTVSDRSSRGERPDASGPILAEAMRALGAEVWSTVVPDGSEEVERVIRAAVSEGARAVITTGGTGIGPRDLTPEGTSRVVTRPLPGVAERLRSVDADAVPGTVLSRGIAGLTGGEHPAIIVNVAGSSGAARSAAAVLSTVLPHALAQLDGKDH